MLITRRVHISQRLPLRQDLPREIGPSDDDLGRIRKRTHWDIHRRQRIRGFRSLQELTKTVFMRRNDQIGSVFHDKDRVPTDPINKIPSDRKDIFEHNRLQVAGIGESDADYREHHLRR